jgi:predicted ferric reductase
LLRSALIWGALAVAVCAPVIASVNSPLLQWRDPVYIFAGLAGVVGMAMMLVQPLLVIGVLPGVSLLASRRLHRAVGATLVLAVLGHVIGLWVTSPPDVMDVLLFRSPTPFAIWGALAMWAVFGAALLAALRLRLPLRLWRWGHTGFVGLAVVGTVVHALQIVGTMEVVTKSALAALVIAALVWAIARRRVWAMGLRPRRS